MEIVTLSPRKDRAPWLLLPCVLLALSSVTLLVPRRAAQAAPPQSVPKPTLAAYDDGDGDELLEHWGDQKYLREQRLQGAGIVGGFALLGIFTYRKRSRRRSFSVPLAVSEVYEQRKAA